MYVIFDMDGVIVNSEIVYRAGHRYAAKVLGLSEEKIAEGTVRVAGVTQEREEQIWGEIFEELPDFEPVEIIRLFRSYFVQELEAGRVELKPGTAQILRFLRERKIPVGLASSTSGEQIRKVLGILGVLESFDVIVSGDMVTRGKPDPGIFLTCAGQMGIPEAMYSETYVIEDSYNGIRAAHAAGMRPIMVPDLLPPTEEMLALSEVVLPSLEELQKWLEQRNN